MPPLYRIDVGKKVHYALDDAEREGMLDRIEAERNTGKVNDPALQRPRRDEPVAAPRDDDGTGDTPPRAAHGRGQAADAAVEMMDMLLAKKRASDRRDWLQEKGNLADI